MDRVSNSSATMTVIWAVLLVAGFIVLTREAYLAAPPTTVAPFFPPESALTFDRDRPTLLVFAHPRCPCTRATFRELDEIRAETNDRLAVTIVFTLPQGVPVDFEKGDLWNFARRMEGIHIVTDQAGIEARRFSVTGSGHVLVYAPSGRLLFSGGITPSRGHEGDSQGRSAIVALAQGALPRKPVLAPVYGCSLL